VTVLPALVLAAAALVPPAPYSDPLAKPASPCPAWLTAWTFNGSLDSGDSWTADFLEVRGDRARIAELSIRSQPPRLPQAESDWFWPEAWPSEPAAFSIARRPVADKPLDDLCRALLRTGLGAVIGQAKAKRGLASTNAVLNMTIGDPEGESHR
jgi:hypothetical protein